MIASNHIANGLGFAGRSNIGFPATLSLQVRKNRRQSYPQSPPYSSLRCLPLWVRLNRLNLVIGSSWSGTGRACRPAVNPFSPGGEKDSRIQTIADFWVEVIKRIIMALVLLPIVSVFFQRNHSGLSMMAAKTRGAIKGLLSIHDLFRPFREQILACDLETPWEDNLLWVLLT